MRNYKPGLAFIIAAISVLACSKEVLNRSNTAINQNDANATSTMQSATAVTSICDRFAYTDTIFYPAELPNDYVVKPINKLLGTYGAFPDGLKINSLNGNIDITESETGLKYIVWFVPSGTTDTCKKFLTVSGINYTDSIYVLANNTGVATPVYNANSLKPTDCRGGCEFDDGHDDDDGDGFADEPPAGQQVIQQGIAMNKSTGAINLKKSIQNGALGKNPASGTYKDFVLNYRISDKSAKTLNRIGFRLYFYKTKAEIPASLKSELRAKQSLVLQDDDSSPDDHFISSTPTATNTIITARRGAGEIKCRPPYIIITQQ
jgi:hypothetical protein